MNDRELIEGYEIKIGEMSILALELGGEPLLDRLMSRLGVAVRHLERLRSGTLIMSIGVVREIEDSIYRAKELLG